MSLKYTAINKLKEKDDIDNSCGTRRVNQASLKMYNLTN